MLGGDFVQGVRRKQLGEDACQLVAVDWLVEHGSVAEARFDGGGLIAGPAGSPWVSLSGALRRA